MFHLLFSILIFALERCQPFTSKNGSSLERSTQQKKSLMFKPQMFCWGLTFSPQH